MTPKNPRSSASLGNGYGQKRGICLCTAYNQKPLLASINVGENFLKWQNKRRKTCLAMFRVNRQTFVFAHSGKTFLPLYFHSKKNQTCIQGPYFQDPKILTLSISVCVETAGMQPSTHSTGSATSREGKI